jgi:hypothetical protein
MLFAELVDEDMSRPGSGAKACTVDHRFAYRFPGVANLVRVGLVWSIMIQPRRMFTPSRTR